jgi:rod shape-determining protein MreD
MRFLLLLTSVGGSSVAQSSVVPALSIGGITPDLPLILTVLVALRRGPEVGCVVGFCAGFLQDVTGGGLIGVQALTKALAGFAMGLLVGRFWVSSPLVQVPGLVLLTVAEGLARFFLLQFFHFPVSLGGLMMHVVLPQALYNGFIGAACVVMAEGADAARKRGWV